MTKQMIPVMQVAIANETTVRVTIIPIAASNLFEAQNLWRKHVRDNILQEVVTGALMPTHALLDRQDIISAVLQIRDKVQHCTRQQFMVGQYCLTNPMASDGYWQFVKL